MSAKVSLGLICITLAFFSLGGEYFIATNGTPQGDGSRLHPWDIVTALADNTKTQSVNYVVKPGDTIWLRGGTYGTGGSWVVTSKLTGISNQPVVLRQHPGERAAIDGGISALGAWTTFWGFEIMNSSTNRYGTGDTRPPGLNLLGLGHRCINLIIHDVGHPGIGYWSVVGPDAEIYGCLLWNNGLYSYDPGFYGTKRGSAIYAQNTSGSRYITDVVSFKNFTFGIKVYTEQGWAEGFSLSGNVAFENVDGGYHIDAMSNSITNAILTNNISYNNGVNQFGTGLEHKNILIANNYFAHDSHLGYFIMSSLKGWTNNVVFTNNVFVSAVTGTNENFTNVYYQQSVMFWNISTNPTAVFNVNGNEYYGGCDNYGGNFANYALVADVRKPWAYVRGLGWETTGERHTNASLFATANLPTNNVVVLRTNKYERGRAHLVVLNWLTNSSASVDISSVGLQNGEGYEVRDVQNYLGTPAVTGTYSSSNPTISVPLNLTNCSQFIGTQTHYTRDPSVHTKTAFNTFVILRMIRQERATLWPPRQLHVVSGQ